MDFSLHLGSHFAQKSIKRERASSRERFIFTTWRFVASWRHPRSPFLCILHPLDSDFFDFSGMHVPPKLIKKGLNKLENTPLFFNLAVCCLLEPPFCLHFSGFVDPLPQLCFFFSLFLDPCCSLFVHF